MKREVPLFGINQLPINNSLGQAGLRKVHPRMHTGNLRHGVLKPCCVGLYDIVGKLLLSLLEEFVHTS